MDKLTFREVRPPDAELLAAMHGLCFAQEDSWSAESFALTLAMPAISGWIISCAGNPAGFILGQLVAPSFEIVTFCILPDCRRRGYGGKLLSHAVKSAADAGCDALFLDVEENNAAALALYSRVGFKRIGLRKDYYRRANQSPKSALILSLRLSPRSEKTRKP